MPAEGVKYGKRARGGAWKFAFERLRQMTGGVFSLTKKKQGDF